MTVLIAGKVVPIIKINGIYSKWWCRWPEWMC